MYINNCYIKDIVLYVIDISFSINEYIHFSYLHLVDYQERKTEQVNRESFRINIINLQFIKKNFCF